MPKGGKTVPVGFKARFYTDRKTFVVCHIYKVLSITKNARGQIKHTKLSAQPVSVGVSIVNLDAGDEFDKILTGFRSEELGNVFPEYSSKPGLGKHIALQRALDAMPKENVFQNSGTGTATLPGALITWKDFRLSDRKIGETP